jgi:hypothetical protein
VAAPTFVTTAATVYNDAASPKAVTGFTVAVGDIIIAKASAENGDTSFPNLPSGSGTATISAFTALANLLGTGGASDGDKPRTAIWWAEVTSVAGGTSAGVSLSASGTAHWGFRAEVWRDSDGVGTVFSGSADGSAPSVTASTAQADSAITWQNNDWNALDGASRVYRESTAGTFTEETYYYDSARYTVYGGYHANAGAAGSKTIGLSAPGSQRWALVGVEVKGTASATATVDQSTFRWGEDDGSESAHTWAAAESTNITAAKELTKLIRLQLNGTGDPASTAFKLQYSKNSGAWTDVTVDLPEDIGTASYNARGAAANVTTSSGSLNVNYPSMTGATSATALYLVVTGRHNTANTAFTVPSGWTLVDELEGGTGTWAADAGTRRAAVYRKDTVTGSESGTIAVSIGGTTASTVYASIVRVDPPAGYVIQQTATDGADTSAGTAVSITAGGTLTYNAGDLILVAHASPSDTGGVVGSPSLTATGTTFGSLTSRASIAVTGGNDHRHVIYTASVTDAGSAAAPTFAYTASGTNSGNASGPAVFVRIRAYRAPNTNEVKIPASANITAGGEATTARLTAPSGKTTSDFDTGRRWDDENGTDSVDITLDDYTELEWPVYIGSTAATNDTFDFRVAGLDTYSATPRWTIAAASGAISGTGSLSLGQTGTLTATGALAGTGTMALGQSGTLTGRTALSGTATLALGQSGTLTGVGALAGSGTLTVGQAGTLVAVGALAGTATITFGQTGTLEADLPPGELVGTAALSLGQSGTLTATGALFGTGTLAIGGSGTAVATGALAGTATLAINGSATLTGRTALAGSATLALGQSGTLTGRTALAGTGAIALDASGTLTANGNLAGLASLTFGASGTPEGGTPPAVTDVLNGSLLVDPGRMLNR